MSYTRRHFCGLIGATVPGLMLEPGIAGAARWADPIRLDSNENPYGPSPAARAAMVAALTDGGRYPTTQPLVNAIAAANGVAPANVLLTVGATEGLVISAKTFTRPDAPLVTAAPSYGAIAIATEQLGHPVIRVPIRADGGIDLAQTVERARGAGLVYICNPNNPTGSLIGAPDLRTLVARIASLSPAPAVVIGEVYHEYLTAPAYASMAPEAIQSPALLVNRTFSKLYGLAGLRLGYLIGREDTLQRVTTHRVSLGANAVAIAAATAVLADAAERVRQRDLNRAGREGAERFFKERRLRFYPAEANYLFVDVGRDVVAFRAACQARGLLIGRPYPPADTWARITIGTPDEMRRAFVILDAVLG